MRRMGIPILIALIVLVATGPMSARAVETPAAVDGRLSFVNDVLPVLSKVGCNQGKCHGNSLGKGGFRLSLRGFAPELDYTAIRRGELGRRVDLVRPRESLILQKPTQGIPHQGGRVLAPDSPGYQILLTWLSEGAPGRDDGQPSLERLEIEPDQTFLERDKTVPLRVWAHFSDASRRDVTRWARYLTNDNTVAAVNGDGVVRAAGSGKAAVSAAYGDLVAAAELIVPFGTPSTTQDAPGVAAASYVDRLVTAQWRQLRLQPSPPADDATFLRRLWIDVTGMLPTPEHVRAFLASENPGKRSAEIDRLLESSEFVDMWTQKWGDILRLSREWLGEKAMWTFHRYLRHSIRDNVPWDEVVRQLVAGTGDSGREGPPNFFRLQNVFNQPELWPTTAAESTAQTFLGVRMQCARCHNHPLDRWTQADYYSMVSFFSQVRAKQSPEGYVVIHDRGAGEIDHPRLGKAMPSKPLADEAMPADAPLSRRQYLARWITAPENPYFARVTVNRIWQHFMGRGLVEPVDDLRSSNPPTNGLLLDALADDLVRHGFDTRHLMRNILLSGVYQLSSVATEANRDDLQFYSHYLPRRMTAEQILDSLGTATGVRETFSGLPPGVRAQQLPDTKIPSTFLDTFGRPLRRVASCECERVQQVNMAQALELMHSGVLHDRVTTDEALVARMLVEGRSDEAVLQEIYLRTLSRPPSGEESAALLGQYGELDDATPAEGRAAVYREFFEDLLWAVLNSKEFLFNH